jgi:hypothetical protein
MSSKYDIKTCHRATVKTASEGILLSPIENYGKYAYWCAEERMKGWRAQPCVHLKNNIS